MDVTGNGSKVQCSKEQYCLGTLNVRSMNQGKLKVVRQMSKGSLKGALEHTMKKLCIKYFFET